ncbi:cilia- and flagella-associated protein 69-like isoform X2 [Epargyreus clarus]|uniref:cilia- and flagella-associated protein 69-like isoform X2 n=1 Tax=Epargyreus clarus TaxID=520877 RepID=UPI003C2FE54E
MEKRSNESPKTKKQVKKAKSKNTITNVEACESSKSSSHTQFFRKPKYEGGFERISKKEYFGASESISGSSDTFHCVHGPGGKIYSEKGQLKRNLIKELDPIPTDRKWTESCTGLPANGWDIAKTLEFLVTDAAGCQQIERLNAHIRDLGKIAERGYRIDILNSLCTVVDYLVDAQRKEPRLREGLELLLRNMKNPIRLGTVSDAVKYFEQLQNFIGFLGVLLIILEEDEHFGMVSEAIIFNLSAPDRVRGLDAAPQRYVLEAAASVLDQTIARMLAVTRSSRFPTFVILALLLASDSVDNCIKLMKENIIENILCRFNPYFPVRDLPVYEVNPAEPQSCIVKLGDSSINMSTILSLLLVLLKTTMYCIEENPKLRLLIPSPSDYAQRCYIWAFRFECRAREHQHERNTLTVITALLLRCFGDRLTVFSSRFMPDIMSMAVATEVPLNKNWIRTVNFNTSQLDVQFKKTLIYLSVEALKIFPYNSFMIESQHWLLGLMYLLDPGLCSLRAHWSHALFAELRLTALKALVIALPFTASNVTKDYGIIRRIMWYIEWYSENPYDLQVLYWCVRLLQVAISTRQSPSRPIALQDLFDTHGIIILMHLCYALVAQKTPPVEKSQVIISLCLRLLTSAMCANERVGCCVYPFIKWPSSINSLAETLLDKVLFSLDKHLIISDRWLISLLNFIWEGIIWKKEYRSSFVSNDGIYKLLDLITMTRAPVQCIALAIVCDVARAGDAVGQLVTWRAKLAASDTNPRLVKRGATIASLLAAIFRDDCKATHVPLDENGIILNLDNPLMSRDLRDAISDPDFVEAKSKVTPVCLAAADMAGSRKSKAILVLCSHYLTIKYNETWMETKIQSPDLLPQDQDILDEFLHISKGWSNEIKRQQEEIIEKAKKKDIEEECSLYAFLGRVRLNIALDALREVRCTARSADRERMSFGLIYDAVFAHHRRALAAKMRGETVLRTYKPPLDHQNVTGQYVKVFSIHPKNKPKPRDDVELSA